MLKRLGVALISLCTLLALAATPAAAAPNQWTGFADTQYAGGRSDFTPLSTTCATTIVAITTPLGVRSGFFGGDAANANKTVNLYRENASDPTSPNCTNTALIGTIPEGQALPTTLNGEFAVWYQIMATPV